MLPGTVSYNGSLPVSEKFLKMRHFDLIRPGFFIFGMALPAAAPADFYLGAELGLADSRTLESIISGQNNPTRCDVLLYRDATRPAAALRNDPACTSVRRQEAWRTRFDAGRGVAAGVQAGYVRDRFRVELEFLHVKPGSAGAPVITAWTHPTLASKDREWSETAPPYEWISDFRIRQYFANVFYDFASESRWTPYVGVGAGWARVRAQYRNRFLRKTVEEGYLEVGSDIPGAQREYGWDEASWLEWRENAAGTLTAADTGLSDTLFGFQLLAGVDYALDPRTSLGIKARWAQFDDFRDGLPYDRIRGHVSVYVDGVTPLMDDVRIGPIEYWAITASIKHRF